MNNNIIFQLLQKNLLIITFLTNNSMIWIIICFLMLFKKKYIKFSFVLIIGLLLSYFFIIIVYKFIVFKPRPFIIYSNIKLFINQPLTLSFPSGHTLTSLLFTEIPNYYKFKKNFYFWIIFSFIIILSRLYFNMHFIFDIFFSSILSYFIILNVNILKKLI